MELYYVMSIVDRRQADAMLGIHKELQLSVVLENLGHGTATSEHLLLYDLEQSDKAVITTVASAPLVKKLIATAEEKLYIDIPGNGIMMALPMKSVGGGKALSLFTEGQEVGGGVPMMTFEHELIVVILNEGYSDTVMDAARSAGATGGTVLHAKGTGKGQAEKFYGVSLAEEKDMIYILAAADKKAAIMKAVNKHCGAGTAAGAVSFSLPVSEVAGLRRLTAHVEEQA